MHRVKVRVAEGALDANDTIARANRADFDRAGVERRQPHERAGVGQDLAARARRWRTASATCASGVLEGDVQGSLDADRLAHLHVPVTQLNTGGGFGGECHLDANMVRSALDEIPLGEHRPADRRERRQPRLPGRVPDRRGRADHGRLGRRGRGQAAEVPADVPRLRAGDRQQDRPAARTSTSTSSTSPTTSTRSTRACAWMPVSARTGEGVEELAAWLAGVPGRTAGAAA